MILSKVVKESAKDACRQALPLSAAKQLKCPDMYDADEYDLTGLPQESLEKPY